MTNHYEAKQCDHIWFDVTVNGDQFQIHACAKCGAKKKTSFDEYTDNFTHLENHISPNTGVIEGMKGTKHDDAKPRFSLIPSGVLQPVIRVLGFGAKKYSEDNWQHVPNARTRYFDAMHRHIDAWWQGETKDQETGEHHLAHAICCAMFLMWLDGRGVKGQGYWENLAENMAKAFQQPNKSSVQVAPVVNPKSCDHEWIVTDSMGDQNRTRICKFCGLNQHKTFVSGWGAMTNTNSWEEFSDRLTGKSDEFIRGAAMAWQHQQNEIDQLKAEKVAVQGLVKSLRAEFDLNGSGDQVERQIELLEEAVRGAND